MDVTLMFLRKSPRGAYAAASIVARGVILTTFAFICFAISRYDYLHDSLLSVSNQNQNTPKYSKNTYGLNFHRCKDNI